MNLQEYKKTKYPFEEYLKEIHSKQYVGLDDEMSDDFDLFLGNMMGEDYIEHANVFSKMLLDLIEVESFKGE